MPMSPDELRRSAEFLCTAADQMDKPNMAAILGTFRRNLLESGIPIDLADDITRDAWRAHLDGTSLLKRL
jgi:hypothetical protein